MINEESRCVGFATLATLGERRKGLAGVNPRAACSSQVAALNSPCTHIQHLWFTARETLSILRLMAVSQGQTSPRQPSARATCRTWCSHRKTSKHSCFSSFDLSDHITDPLDHARDHQQESEGAVDVILSSKSKGGSGAQKGVTSRQDDEQRVCTSKSGD